MTDMKQVHAFAVKWCYKFCAPQINYTELLDHHMAYDCDALGFDMDYGNAFYERYGKAVNDHDELDKIIDDVNDVDLLGSAIYSRWRYFNHWAYKREEILERKNRSWFILALGRLIRLTSSFKFEATPKEIRIVSNNISEERYLNSTDEVEQDITINSEGQVWFSAYTFGKGFGQHEKTRSKNYRIEKVIAEIILNTVATHFCQDYHEFFATDSGNWQMELTNTDGVTYQFEGSLYADFDVEGIDLSDLIRALLAMEDLFVFDGNYKPDKVTRITVDYHRVTKIKSKQPISEETKYVTWNYKEQLIVDRELKSIEHIQNIGCGCTVSHKYKVADGVEELLDDLDANSIFENIVGNPTDVIETPNETKDYTITINFKKNPQRIIEGTYDKNGLPDDWAEFADKVSSFMRFYGFGEMLNPSIYNKAKRRKEEYIFCRVIFDEGYKSYYYIADDEEIEVGDFVLVPAGKDNHTAVVEVIDIEYFSKENAPLPLDKTKHIISKYTDDI